MPNCAAQTSLITMQLCQGRALRHEFAGKTVCEAFEPQAACFTAVAVATHSPSDVYEPTAQRLAPVGV